MMRAQRLACSGRIALLGRSASRCFALEPSGGRGIGMVSNAPPTRRRHHFRLADDVCKIHFEPKVGGQGGADYASIKRGSLSCTFFYFFRLCSS